MTRRLATLLAPLAVAAIAVLASGCGASLDPVAQAATRTSDVSTLRFSMDLAAQLPNLTTPVHVTARGAIDAVSERVGMTMDLSRVAAAAGAPAGLGRLTMVLDGGVMYMNAPALAGSLPGGKTWLRVDLARAAQALGADLSAFTSGQTDPRTTLAQLREAGNVVEIGPATVRGTPATRYSVLLDMRAGIERLHGALREAAERALDRLEAAGHRYVPATAWVDGEGYLRRFRATIPDYLGAGTSFSLTMDLFDFGAGVQIAVPAAIDVVDVTDRLPG